MKKNLIIFLIAVFACTAFTACGVTTLDPEDYCEIDVNGANGYGKASISIDYEDLGDDLSDCLGDDSSKKERQKAIEFAGSIEFNIISDNEGELSNGDIVEIEIDYDEDEAKEDYKFKFKNTTFKYEVEDLDEAEPINPFEGLEIIYNGFSPNARYDLSNKNCDDEVKSFFYYEVVETPERVANGDKITVKAICHSEDRLLEEGYVMSADTKEFTVSGLEEGKVLDPFANIKIEYKGISPYAEAIIDTSACDDYIKNNVSFRIENNGNLANGENIVIKANYDESKAEQNGIVFSTNEKSVLADGVPVYLNTLDGVKIEEIDSQYNDYVTQKLANDNWYNGSADKNISYLTGDSWCKYTVETFDIVPVKKILLTPKNIKDNSTKSYYVIIYRLDGKFVKSKKDGWCNCGVENGATVNATFYIECKAKNIAVNADGSINSDKMKNLDYDIYWPKDYNYNVSLDTICEGWRTKNISDFNVAITDVATKKAE